MQNFEEFIVYKRQDDTSWHWIYFREIYRFPNGYGASVIQSEFANTYCDDEYEVAVIKFYNAEGSIGSVWDFDTVYHTHLTDGTLGYCKWDEVLLILEEIKNLT